MTTPALGVLEEFVAFLIDRKARRIHIDNWTLKCGVGGAILLDLVLAKRIVVETRGSGLVSVADATPTSIEFLDDVLSAIAETPDERGAQHWVSTCANRADDLIAVALERLAADGVISIDGDGNYSIADDTLDTGQYPGVLSPPHSRQSPWVRLPRIVCGECEPTIHDVALICLAHVCGEFQRQFTPEQMESARPRLVAIERQDSSCEAITQAVRSCFRDIVVRKSTPKRIPKIKIKDFLSPTMRCGDLGRWFAELSEKYGPVFELPQPGNRQVVLASAEANYWTERSGWKYLRAKDYVTGYEEVYGCPGSILSTDGPEHSHLRQLVIKRGPLAVLEDRADDIFRLCRHYYKRWISGRVHLARSEMLMLMSKIVAEIGLGVHADHVIPGLKEYEVRAVKTQIMRILPRRMMHTRKMRRIRAQLDELVDKIIHSHENAGQLDRPRNLSDEILLQHRGDPHALPVEHLTYAFLSVLVAGQNLGNLLSFALYELINNPHLLKGIRAEADAIFDAPPPHLKFFQPLRLI